MKKKYITFYIIVSIFVLFIGLTLCQFEQFNNPILLPSQNQNIENEGAEAASNSFSVTLTSYIRNRYGSTITGMNIELYVSSGYKGDYNWKYHVYYSSGSYGKRTGSLTRILGQKYRGLCIETSCDYTGRKTSWVGYKATDSSNSNVYAELLTSSAVSIMADTRSYFTGMTISSICSSGFKNDVDYNDNYASPNFYIYLYPNILYSFDMNGGSSSNGANTSIIYNTKDQRMQLYNGNTMSKLTVPNRTGYTFAGYYTAKSGGTQVIDADGEWTGNWNLDNIRIAPLYAHWTANKYTVTLNKNGGSGGSSTVTATYNSTMPSITPPSKEGYQFLGYWDKTSGGTQYYNANGKSVRNWNKASNATLYAKWEQNTYTVNLNLQGGGGATSPINATYDRIINIPNPTKTGYKFTGWSVTSGLDETTAKSGTTNSLTELTEWDGTETKNTYFANLTAKNKGTVELSAQWESYVLTYSFNSDGGSSYKGGTAYYGGTITLPTPTKKGYTFIGWKHNNNNKVYPAGGYSVNSDIANGDAKVIFIAQWQANKYTINLNLQGGSGGTTTVTATYDSAMPTIKVPSKFGYTFEGYYDSDGTKYYNAKGTSARNWDKDSTATLNAKWTAYNYTLTLYGNDNITSDKQTTKTITGSYASNLTLPSKPFTRIGYIFKGWSTTKTGSVTYLDEANYSSLITSNDTKIILYAQWEETIASNIKSTFETAGTYYISTAEDLAKLIYTTENKDVGNGYTFIQTANIDLSGLTYLPIGRLNSFSGTYDGQGNIISGITTYNGTDINGKYLEENSGLFANASGAKIKNVIIEKATIYGQNAGIIAGSGNSETAISGCIVSGNVNGTNKGSIIGNGKGAKISVCLAKGVNTVSFASGSASIDSCIYELNNTNKTRGKSNTFNKYNEWIYPSNFEYPMPKAMVWYPYPELTKDSLNSWMDR